MKEVSRDGRALRPCRRGRLRWQGGGYVGGKRRPRRELRYASWQVMRAHQVGATTACHDQLTMALPAVAAVVMQVASEDNWDFSPVLPDNFFNEVHEIPIGLIRAAGNLHPRGFSREKNDSGSWFECFGW